MKKCRECKIDKDLDKFGIKDYKTGRRATLCNSCHYKRYKNDPKFKYRQKAAARKVLYGITDERFKELLASQNNLCAICKQEDSRVLSVDHDHATGSVRGLLCNSCNIGLGMFKDSRVNLENAIHYLFP